VKLHQVHDMHEVFVLIM